MLSLYLILYSIPVIATILFTLIIRILIKRYGRRGANWAESIIIAFIILTLSFVAMAYVAPPLMVFATTFLVQDAMDEQCPELGLEASDGEFVLDSPKYWTSDTGDVECQLGSKVRCYC